MSDTAYVQAPPTPQQRPLEAKQSGKAWLADQQYQAGPKFSQLPNPLATASVWSLALAHWFQPLVSLGAKRVIENVDIWPVCPEDSCDALEKRFLKECKPSTGHCGVQDEPNTPFGLSPTAWTYIKTFQHELVVVFANCFFYIVALAFQAYVAQAMLQFLNGRENLFHIQSGYVLLTLMTLSSLAAVSCLNYAFWVTSRVGVNMRTLTMDLVYQKSLRLSSAARQEYTAGEVLTLMSVDAERVFNAMMQGPWLLVSFFAFVVTVVVVAILFNIYSALCGAVVLLFVLGVSVRQSGQISRVQRDLLSVMDERVKVTSEALQGIRVMKFYAWEESLAHRVEKIRDVEVSLLRKFHVYQVGNTVMLFLTPAFLAGVTLGVYVLIRHTITLIEAFTLIAMVNICRSSATVLPQAIAALSQAKIAYNRIDAYLASDEFDVKPLLTAHATTGQQPPVGSISVRDGQFEWLRPASSAAGVVIVSPEIPSPLSADERKCSSSKFSEEAAPLDSATSGFRLEGVNLEVDAGSLVMVVGTVGAGKSSLLSAMLGEMTLTSGHMTLSGGVAYVSQEAWIRNLSLRENILFESPFDADRYEQVLEATQLGMDLAALPDGDQTEIGERGINLSGGQKARVAIARSMYRAQYDVLLLDDPLSAVDPHVAHAIFDQCIVGLAKHKTRVLVLNSHYDLLTRADKVVVVEDGRIVADGTYDEVLAQFPALGAHSKQLDDLEGDIIDENDVNVTESKKQAEQLVEAVPEVQVISADDAASGGEGKVGAEEGEAVARLVQEEDRVRGKVSGYTYKTYFDETGLNAVVVLIVIVAAYGVSQGVRVLVDWWPSHWARNMTRYDVDPSYSGTAFGMWYLGFIVACTVLTLGRALLMVEFCVRSSKNLHEELFRRVLRAPVNGYFDVTPVGRILNRFSNDLDQMDSILPQQYQIFFQNSFVCLGSLVVSAFASYWIAISYVPMIVLFVVIGQYFKKTSAEVKRLEGIARTPVYNLFGETLTGLQTIRAFRMQSVFRRRNKQLVDENTTLYCTYWSAGRWLAVRLDLLSVIIIFVVTLYLTATKGQIGPTVAGLSLTYSLMLTSQVQWVMRAVDRTDNAMTSVERLLHFREIPVEEEDGSACLPVDMSEWPSQGAITFDNLCLKYRPELPLVLRGVNMSVAGGEKVGICGRTG
ncbi:hypothetical protein BBJ28_00024128, partial [Nothophytophthora sp. Chile5]